jgi:hypothetical protein
MDSVYRDRVNGIRQRMGCLLDRMGATATLDDRDRFANWVYWQRDGDKLVLSRFSQAVAAPTPPGPDHAQETR